MALLVYQNQLSYDLIIPGWESTFHLYPNEYVAGEYYSQFPPSMLTDVTDQNIPIGDIKYIYPGSTDSPSEGGAIDSINGVAPILTSTLLGVTTISLDTLTGSLFGLGEIVKGINGLTDLITIEGGAGISVDSLVDTITINNTQLGLTDTYATLPLILTLGEGNVSLEGSIAITPTDDGGAVALQTGTPTYQNDFAALRSLYLESALDVDPFIRAYDASSNLLSSLDKDGTLFTQGILTESIGSTLSIVYSSIAYDGTDYTTLIPRVVLDGSELEPNYFDLSFDLRDVITLDKSTVSPGEIGRIEGEQEVTYTNPFITLRTIPDQTTPLIELIGGYTSGTANNNIYLDVVDDQGDSLISLHGDGIITAKTVEADTVDVTTLNADNIYVTSYSAVGPTTVNVTTAGPQTIMGDCSLGEIVIQLPDLNTFDKSLSVTIIKTDLSNNAISIVNGLNSTINGSPLAVDLIDQYETLTIVSNGINWFKIGAM